MRSLSALRVCVARQPRTRHTNAVSSSPAWRRAWLSSNADEPVEVNVIALTVAKVLLISKQAFQGLSDTYPEQMGLALGNLQAKAESDMKFELTNAMATAQLSEEHMEILSQ